MKFYIKKTTKRRKNGSYINTYEVFAESGEKICQRRSPRDYVACLCRIELNKAMYVGYASHWFGRKDLIGKGDSRHFINSPGYKVVHLKENGFNEKPNDKPL